MDDDTDTKTLPFLWVDWAGHILSFHKVAGYERLVFSSNEEKMKYVLKKGSNGFRSQ